MSESKKTIAVLGAGSWGTALALLLAGNGHAVKLWDRDEINIAKMQQDKCNQQYLPDFLFPNNLSVNEDFNAAIADADIILLVTPSHAFREVTLRIKQIIQPMQKIVWACKGIDPESNQLLDSAAREIFGNDTPLAVLSGPSFAKEVAAELPTAVTIAASSQDYADELSNVFSNAYFRVYTTLDLISVELGGAVKNVLAIATGIADGMGFGANARSGLITRGLAELMRLGLALGGKQETLIGLSGLGDLILTCTDNQSRNRRFGLAIGRGTNVDDAIKSIGQVVEGYKTTEQVYKLAQKNAIEMPITEQIYLVLYQQLSPQQAVKNLLSRSLKAENSIT